ncbi:hypothetical protein ACTID9_26850 [Brevibacillus fluminis]|uniref:hypothetical protein n=1 Tax=Brevibacillus fluminis TaxID=511487 RepID=UPI003F8ADFBF
MKWEKVVASTMVLNMLAFAPASAFADASGGISALSEQTPQSVLDRVDDLKNALPELKKLQLNYVNAQEDTGSRPALWSVHLAADSGQKLTATAHIVFEQKSGDIVQYEYKTLDWQSPAPPTAALAKKAAAAFSDSLLPGSYAISDELIVGEPKTNKENLLGVKVYQKVNGIPLQNGWSTIWVDWEGHVVSYQQSDIKLPKEDTFPNRFKVITPETAREAFAKEVEVIPASKNNEYTYKIMYKNAINAVSGAAEPADPHQDRFVGIQPVSTAAKPLTVQTVTEAMTLLTSSFDFEPGTLPLKESIEKDGAETVKLYTWGPAVTTDVQSVEVRTVPKTGLIKSVALRRHQASAPADESGAADRALPAGIRFAQQYLPADVESISIKLRSCSDNETEIEMQPVSKDGILNDSSGFLRIIANKFSGKISRFEYDPQTKQPTVPANKNAVPLETAKAMYLKQLKLELFYVVPLDPKESPKLVYLPAIPSQSTYMNPVTGEITTEQDDWQSR